MKTIWLVIAESGQYDDYETWVISSHPSKEMALEFMIDHDKWMLTRPQYECYHYPTGDKEHAWYKRMPKKYRRLNGSLYCDSKNFMSYDIKEVTYYG